MYRLSIYRTVSHIYYITLKPIDHILTMNNSLLSPVTNLNYESPFSTRGIVNLLPKNVAVVCLG